MGLVVYISRRPNQKVKIVSAYDYEFIVAKLQHNSGPVNSLNLKSTEPAIHLIRLKQAHEPAYQITSKLRLHIIR